MCSLAKSFVPVTDHALIRRGAERCIASVDAMRDMDVPYRVSVAVQPGVRKRISTAHGSNLTPRDIIGEIPVVALSPDHKSITLGGPAERRAFIDGVMAQSSKRYTELLYEHRRLLKQRNAVLQSGVGPAMHASLDVWTEQFVMVSAEIVERRQRWIADVAPRVREAYQAVAGVHELIDITYEPDVCTQGALSHDAELTLESVADAYRALAAQLRVREMARESTMFGPQKDELAFHINGGLVRETASQGQHKSLLVALKLAECDVLHEHCSERPVVLLDDVFSELDRDRCARVLERVVSMGMQCFVTTTDGDEVVSMIETLSHVRGGQLDVKLMRVADGRVTDGDVVTTHHLPSAEAA
jgi:DNA replication and repair protein RecF